MRTHENKRVFMACTQRQMKTTKHRKYKRNTSRLFDRFTLNHSLHPSLVLLHLSSHILFSLIGVETLVSDYTGNFGSLQFVVVTSVFILRQTNHIELVGTMGNLSCKRR